MAERSVSAQSLRGSGGKPATLRNPDMFQIRIKFRASLRGGGGGRDGRALSHSGGAAGNPLRSETPIWFRIGSSREHHSGREGGVGVGERAGTSGARRTTG